MKKIFVYKLTTLLFLAGCDKIMAAQENNTVLDNYGMDINYRNNKGKTALDLTKEKKHQVTIDLLVNKGGKTGEELAKK